MLFQEIPTHQDYFSIYYQSSPDVWPSVREMLLLPSLVGFFPSRQQSHGPPLLCSMLTQNGILFHGCLLWLTPELSPETPAT